MSPLSEPTRLSEREEMANVSHPDEGMQPDPLPDSKETQREQNGETHVVSIPAQSGRRRPTGVAGLLAGTQICDPVLCGSLCVLVLFSLTLIIIFTVTAQSRKTSEPCPAGAACSGAICPNSWVGYQGKCYYFSKGEGNWTDSQSNCSALNASLVGIDSTQELEFMKRNRESYDHWIGLWKSPGQSWEWSNGTKFNSSLFIRGGGDCAYVDSEGIASSSCSGQLRWVCCRPEGRPKP
nr:C-type lectin domain family 2 member D-like [Pelodiscus sinensis]XP_014435609.1 C-type lectin domain family 2 member D-like [Pelodiscus sinensis]XP_014435634.1 C-type lectin domain family 2 member D-like [Pelodiscus sinensis]|eukprot:XP_006110448.1 C-type lectin domain family 2 member D-like [Pelodiscus sinensis]